MGIPLTAVNKQKVNAKKPMEVVAVDENLIACIIGTTTAAAKAKTPRVLLGIQRSMA